jgi:hypothetical protein
MFLKTNQGTRIAMLNDDKPKGNKSESFLKCSLCHRNWPSRDAFLADPDVELCGYQADFDELIAGIFLFKHRCGNTLGLMAGDFSDLHDGPIFVERLTGSEHCAGYCRQKNALNPCLAHCECAFVREILQVVRQWPKTEKVSTPNTQLSALK